MNYEDLWDIPEDLEEIGIYKTDNIEEIMSQQCEYLAKKTENKVLAKFGKIRIEGALAAISSISKMNKVSFFPTEVEGTKTITLEDAEDLYEKSIYGFEIYNDTYRYRLFTIEMRPIYPVVLRLDQAIADETNEALRHFPSFFGDESSEDPSRFQIESDERLLLCLKIIFNNRKLKYIISEMRRDSNENEGDKKQENSNKCIICEGRTDEMVFRSICRKLDVHINIVAAGGKGFLAATANEYHKRYSLAKILIVCDADGDSEQSRSLIISRLDETTNIETVAIENSIEDLFIDGVDHSSKIEFMRTIEARVDDINLDELAKARTDFSIIYQFIVS